jgi:hypothetical protein
MWRRKAVRTEERGRAGNRRKSTLVGETIVDWVLEILNLGCYFVENKGGNCFFFFYLFFFVSFLFFVPHYLSHSLYLVQVFCLLGTVRALCTCYQ